VIGLYVPLELAHGLTWIIPEEQPRFLIFVSIANLHWFANALLLIWLGFRILSLRPQAAA